VAFADWLQGFGLIVILDHQDGYMSLYAHNQTLLKETGDWVEADELIASVGDSGGQEKPGLYFEIRHQGTPIDPSNWCRTRQTTQKNQ
jgi:murein hydrolase activator